MDPSDRVHLDEALSRDGLRRRDRLVPTAETAAPVDDRLRVARSPPAHSGVSRKRARARPTGLPAATERPDGGAAPGA